MDITVDRSRKFATVHGERIASDTDHGVYFKQDGLCFDAHGVLINEKVPKERRDEIEARRAKLAKVQPAKKADEETEGEPIEIADASEVNLELWLKTNAKYPWHKITEAIRTRYKANKPSKPAAVEFLVADIKLVPLAEVHRDLRVHLGSN